MRSLAPLLLLCFSLNAFAARIAVPGAGVTFEPPLGFSVLSKAEIATKFPAGRAPAHAVGNSRRTTTIVYELKQDQLGAEQLAEAKAAMEQTFERIVPGLQWKDRQIVELGGQRWILLELTSNAVDADIHNIMLITSRRGRMMIFNFNSTRGEFPSVEQALRESIRSVRFE